jgi:hypothetical protein
VISSFGNPKRGSGTAFESDRSCWRRLTFSQFFQLVKHYSKVFVMRRELIDDSSELTVEFFVGFEHLSQPNERSHDRDVHFNRLFAVSTQESIATPCSVNA